MLYDKICVSNGNTSSRHKPVIQYSSFACNVFLPLKEEKQERSTCTGTVINHRKKTTSSLFISDVYLNVYTNSFYTWTCILIHLSK
jgi:hypothetical protein